MDEYQDDTGQHKSLEEHVLENIDKAAKAAEQPALAALQNANVVKWAVIGLAFYMALVAAACTYAIYKVQNQAAANTQYLVNQCNEGNKTRAAERTVITTLIGEDLALAQLEGYVPSPEELAALKRIQDAADIAWPQRDCGRVQQGKVAPLPPQDKPTSAPQVTPN